MNEHAFRRISIALALVLAATAHLAAAEVRSATMQVSVRVVANCQISVTDLAFGSYDPLLENASKPLDGTADVAVLCTKDLRATVLMMNDGSSTRFLRSGDLTLSYGLFSDPARSRTWGGGTDGVQIVGTGSVPQKVMVYGRVPPSQVVPGGWYTDAVTAVVDF
jgi:spore coat protein U-like protein